MAFNRDPKRENTERDNSGIEDEILNRRRVATKRIGGANMHYSVLTVAGNKNGSVGIGLAKSKEMSAAVIKSKNKARRTMISVPVTKDASIPHEIYIKNGASILFLRPAPLGAGIIAGGAIRKILELAGIKNISAKVIGTNNQISNAYTVMKAFKLLKPVIKKMNKVLSNLKQIKALPKKSKRVGRGAGSGKGSHTSGKGHKGQNARTGGKQPIWFDGNSIPFIRKMPYYGGFVNHNAKNIISFNLSDISNILKDADSISPATLQEKGLADIKKVYAVKILGKGEISKAIKFSGFVYSESAKSKIEKAGGSAE